MSVSRQVRRATERAKKKQAPAQAANVIADLLGQFQALAGASTGVNQLTEMLPDFMGKLEETQQMFAAVLEENAEIRYEAEKQRWVSLRIAMCVNPVDPSDVQSVLKLEEQYRLEYDALRMLLATLALLDDRET